MSSWQAVPDASGRVYYWNSSTNETTWDCPPGFNANPMGGGSPMNTGAMMTSSNGGGTLKSQKPMCERCGQNKAAAKVQTEQGVQKLLCRPCVEAEQQQAAAAAVASGAAASGAAAPQIKIGTYKEPKVDKKEKAILERDWGLDKKKDKALPLADKMRKLEAQLAEIDAAIASEKKKKDGMDQLVGFYAKDPKQQKEVIAEVADLQKVIQTATEHRGLIAAQLLLCQQGNDPLNPSAKRPGGGSGHSAQPLPSAASVFRPTAKKNAALGKTWGIKQVPASLTDAQKVDALYQQLDELEAAIATEVKGKQGLAVLAEQYRNSNPAQFQQISDEVVGIDDDIKRLEAEANRVQADVVALSSPWKEAAAPDGRKYYYHSETGETTWETPAELKREKRKCEQCDDRARLKVTGVDGVVRWLCKAHGSSTRVPALSGMPSGGGGGGGALSPRPRSATSGGPGFAPPPGGGPGFAPPPSGGPGFAPPPAVGFAPPPAAGFAPPPMSPPNAGFAPPPGRQLQRHESTPVIAVPARAAAPPMMMAPPPARGPPPMGGPGGAFAPPPGPGAFAPPPGPSAFAPPPAAFAPPPAAFAPPPGPGAFAPPPAAFAPPPAAFAPPPAAAAATPVDPNVVGYAKAHTKFASEGEGELSLEVGEIVCVLSRDPDGWWKVRLRSGKKGFSPASFLTMLPPGPPPF